MVRSEILYLIHVSFKKNYQVMRNLHVLWMGDVGKNAAI